MPGIITKYSEVDTDSVANLMPMSCSYTLWYIFSNGISHQLSHPRSKSQIGAIKMEYFLNVVPSLISYYL